MPKSLTLTDGSLRVELRGEPGGPITSIEVSDQIIDYQEYLPSFDTTKKPPVISFRAPPVEEDLVGLLWHFESIGSFWLGIRQINWDVARREWVPESNAERALLQVTSISSSRVQYPPSGNRVHVGLAHALLRLRDRFADFVLPMSFLREGINEFRTHRYIGAFFNFYFFLEDLYGDRKTKNRLVLQAFKQSTELRWAISKARAGLAKFEGQESGLQFFLKREAKADDADGLLELIVEMRGNLHHFSRKSSKMKGHPLNQVVFRPIAYLLLGTCLNCASRQLARAGRRGAPERGA